MKLIAYRSLPLLKGSNPIGYQSRRGKTMSYEPMASYPVEKFLQLFDGRNPGVQFGIRFENKFQ